MSSFGIPNVAPELEATLIRQMAEVESLLLSHTRSEYPFVDETAHHLVAAGGKRLRPLLTLLTAQFGDSTREGVVAAAVACEITHLATLYHDDVMDQAPLRRGVESANMRWGNTIAILTGDFLFAKSSDLLADLGPEAVRLQARTFERLVIGQIMETQGPNPGQDPLEHYLKVVADKTGSLIAASARYGGMISGAPAEITETVTKFGEQIGVAFQLADDVIDIASESNQSGKTPGTDLREGVPTLVTLNVMKSTDSADRELKQLLSGPIEDEATVQQVLSSLRTHKALSDSREQLFQIAKEARSQKRLAVHLVHYLCVMQQERLCHCVTLLSTVLLDRTKSVPKVISAIQIIRNPAQRAVGISSWSTHTPIENCRVGVMYCKSPIVDSGRRVVEPLNKSSGIAVIAPALMSRNVNPGV